jgi:hypothetical protein
MNRVVMLAGGSILIGVVVLALKSLAYFITGSVALLSDAIESIINVATAIAAFARHAPSSLKASRKPACGSTNSSLDEPSAQLRSRNERDVVSGLFV